jgi:hypothetical protein
MGVTAGDFDRAVAEAVRRAADAAAGAVDVRTAPMGDALIIRRPEFRTSLVASHGVLPPGGALHFGDIAQVGFDRDRWRAEDRSLLVTDAVVDRSLVDLAHRLGITVLAVDADAPLDVAVAEALGLVPGSAAERQPRTLGQSVREAAARLVAGGGRVLDVVDLEAVPVGLRAGEPQPGRASVEVSPDVSERTGVRSISLLLGRDRVLVDLVVADTWPRSGWYVAVGGDDPEIVPLSDAAEVIPGGPLRLEVRHEGPMPDVVVMVEIDELS